MSTTTEQIKESLDIVDFIRQYLEVKPAGSNFKALCPFHKEDTPSFMISPAKQIFKCFGCGKGGDIFTFLQEYEGIEFKEALRILADKAGVRLPKFNKKITSQRNRLYDILRLTENFYYLVLLKSKSAKTARDYLKKRGLTDLTIDSFKLGYAPDKWRALFDFLNKKGFKEQEIMQTGLIGKSNNRFFDKFRNRLMFPILDEYSRTVGFGGRILKKQKNQAKYINSPQNKIYDKSKVLYGLDKAKEAIRKQDLVVLVEGYMDVISSHQIGVNNVVAASGTALSEHQIKLIKRFTNNLILCFDMDSAGIAAALRCYKIASQLEMNTKVIQLPKGKDPDDLIRHDPKAWKRALEKSQYIVDYYFDIVLDGLNLNNLTDKKQAKKRLLPLIFNMSDQLERAHYLDKLASLLKVDVQVLQEDQAKFVQKQRYQYQQNQFDDKNQSKVVNFKPSVIKYLIALILRYFDVLPKKVDLPKLQDITDKKTVSLYKAIRNQYNKKIITAKKLKSWQKLATDLFTECELLADKEYANLTNGEAQYEFNRLVNVLKQRQINEQKSQLIAELKLAEKKGDEVLVLSLSKKIDKLAQSN